jgi:hypothetical protein
MVIPKNFRFGDAVLQKRPIDFFKMESDERKFIQILDLDSAIAASLHYIKGIGAFYCWTTQDEDGITSYGDCCNLMKSHGLQDKASDKFIVPIVIYGSKDGKTITKDVEFKMLQLSWTEYKELYNTVEDTGIPFSDVKKHILRARGEETGVGQYKRVAPKFTVSQVRSLLADPDVRAGAVEFLAKFRELGKDCIAKTINKDQLVKQIASLTLASAPEAHEEPRPFEPDRVVPKVKEVIPQTQNVEVNELSDLALDEYGLDSIDLSSIIDDVPDFPSLD